MLRILKNQWVIIIGILLIYTLISHNLYLSNYKNTPAERYYFGGDEYAIDMVGNLTNIQNGYQGHWLRISKITTNVEAKGVFLKFEYILIGQLARLLRLDPLLVFHLSRLLLGIFYLGLILKLVFYFFTQKIARISALVLILFGTALVGPVQNYSLLTRFPNDVFIYHRIFFTTHHYLIGAIGSLSSMWFLSKALNKVKTNSSIIIASALLAIVSITYSPSSVLVLLSFPLVFFQVIFYKLIKKKPLEINHYLKVFSLPSIIAVLPLFYVKYLSLNTWDFIAHPPLEKLNPFKVTPTEYLQYGGLPLLFAFLSLPAIVKKKSTLLYFFYSWIIVNFFVEFFLSDKLGFNRIRIFLTPTFVVWGILCMVTIFSFASFILKRFHLRFKNFLILITTVIILLSGYYSHQYNYFRGKLCFCIFPTISYPKKETIMAINWLKTHSSEHDAVMSSFVSGSLISAFSGNDVFTSKFFSLTNLPIAQVNWENVFSFYSNNLSSSNALALLKDNRIKFVLFGEDERLTFNRYNDLSYPFLEKVFQVGETTLYLVRYNN